MMERRQNPRIGVRLPCRVTGPGGKFCQPVGLTQDVSRGGILVRWDLSHAFQLPRPGDLLDLEIELPANHSFGRKCLYCQATAVRVAPQDSGGPLVAFQIHQMRFRDSVGGTLAAIHNQEQLRRLLM